MWGRLTMALAVLGILSAWMLSALADKRVTLAEVAELLKQLGQAMGIKELEHLEIEVPAFTGAASLERLSAGPLGQAKEPSR